MGKQTSPTLRFLFQFLPVILLMLIMAAASLHRVTLYQHRIGYNTQSDVGFFFTEEAFQYRYARMIAEHRPIPGHDKKAQWPEGLYPFKELTLLQEYLHGVSFRCFHRLFPGVPFHIYLTWFVPIFSTLAVLALYLGARVLEVDPWAALLCAALYAFTGGAFARVRFYELECTAFPLLAVAFVLILYGLKTSLSRSWVFALFSGVLLSAALVTWHFTRFYWLAVTTAFGLAYLLFGSDRNRLQLFIIISGCVLITGFIFPVMKTAGLATSPLVASGAIILAGLYLERRHSFPVRRRAVFLTLGIVLAFTISSFGSEQAAYGHVWALFKYKIVNLLVKPENPEVLPLPARILWHGPFNTTTPGFLLYRYGLMLPLALAGTIKLFRQIKNRRDFDGLFLLVTGIGFFISSIMVKRLTIFGSFFLGLIMACLFAGNRNRLIRIILVVCLVLQAGEALSPGPSLFRNILENDAGDRHRVLPTIRFDDELNMLNWIEKNTAPDAVFLSNQERSPSLLTYTGRPIVIHPKFETKHVRDKYIETLLTLYGNDENALYRLFRSYGIDYYLYPVSNLLMTGPDAERYRAGLTRVPRQSLTYRLHFDPDGFSKLRLVFRNGAYQIYRFVREDETHASIRPPYFPVYDEALFRLPGSLDPFFDDHRAEQVLSRIARAYDMIRQAEQSAAMENQNKTLVLIQESITTGLPDGIVYYRAADAALAVNRPDISLGLIQQAHADDPESTRYRKLLARLYLLNNDPDSARPLLTSLSRTTPEDPVVYNYLGIFYWKKLQYPQARFFFEQALKLDPQYETAKKNLSRLNSISPP